GAREAPAGVEHSEELDPLRPHASPARLVTGPQAGPVVPVEVFVEQDVVAPVGIGLELLGSAVHGSPALLVAKEDAREPVGDLLGHFEEVHELARSGPAFDLEAVAVIQIEFYESPNYEDFEHHPPRPPPVGVATEHAGVRLGWQIIDTVLLTMDVKYIRMPLMKFR